MKSFKKRSLAWLAEDRLRREMVSAQLPSGHSHSYPLHLL